MRRLRNLSERSSCGGEGTFGMLRKEEYDGRAGGLCCACRGGGWGAW